MAIRYYPLNRIITNRYTSGGDFILPDGKPYTGRYYTTYDGSSFTGVNPLLGTNIPLLTANKAVSKYGFSNLAVRPAERSNTSVLEKNLLNEAQSSGALTELKPYFPVPTEEDYERGYFMRYFAKDVSGPGYIFEISELTWSKIQNGEVEDTVLGYEVTDMLWQLTGPLVDKRISQYQIQGGVLTTNKRVTEAEAKTFKGLVEYIGGEYTKYARITP